MLLSKSMSSTSTRECGCKGIRTCLLCRSSSSTTISTNDGARHTDSDNSTQVHRFVYQYCLHCQKAWQKKPSLESLKQLALAASNGFGDHAEKTMSCNHDGADTMELPGIDITENFVTQEEESTLEKEISSTPFAKSQSGRQKQDFGPKVNFKKQKLKFGTFNGLPSYSRFLYERMKAYKLLEEFEPVELCNLEYTSDRGAHIDPHFDDTWIWGERLVTLNLLSDSVLSFTHDFHQDLVIQVPLVRRSLIVVSGPARYEWKHSIDPQHICDRRLAMTFRELSDEFKLEGERGEEGQELIKLALSFEGCAIGCAS